MENVYPYVTQTFCEQAQKLMVRISWNTIIFNCIVTCTDTDYILEHIIVQQVVLCLKFLWDSNISFYCIKSYKNLGTMHLL